MGAAIVWVMLFHAFDLDLRVPLLNAICRAGFGGVDVFILLSSMGLVMSLSRRPQEYTAFMARRGQRILPAYFAVMVPFTLYLILARGKTWSSLIWNASLLYYWVRPSGAFNWYVAGAMTFYAVTPWCFARWQRSKHRQGLTALAVGLGLALCQLLTHEGYWQYTDLAYRIPVFFLGLLLGFWVLEDRPLTAKSALFWAACLCAAGGYLYLSLTKEWINWPIHFPQCHLFLFTTVPMCLLICLALDKLPLGPLSRLLDFLGRYSLEIYLLNVSVFSLIDLWRGCLPFGGSNRLYYVIMLPLNVLLAVLLRRMVAAAQSFCYFHRAQISRSVKRRH